MIQNKGSQHHERTLVQLVVHSALTVYTALGHSDWIAHNAFLCVVLILHKHAFITYMYFAYSHVTHGQKKRHSPAEEFPR